MLAGSADRFLLGLRFAFKITIISATIAITGCRHLTFTGTHGPINHRRSPPLRFLPYPSRSLTIFTLAVAVVRALRPHRVALNSRLRSHSCCSLIFFSLFLSPCLCCFCCSAFLGGSDGSSGLLRIGRKKRHNHFLEFIECFMYDHFIN